MLDAKRDERKLHTIEQVRGNLEDNCELEMIAEFLRENPENVKLIYDAIHVHPGTDDDGILELIRDSWKD